MRHKLNYAQQAARERGVLDADHYLASAAHADAELEDAEHDEAEPEDAQSQ